MHAACIQAPAAADSWAKGEAANRAIMIADMTGVPLYIVHVSCEDAHEAIRRARMQGTHLPQGGGQLGFPGSDLAHD